MATLIEYLDPLGNLNSSELIRFFSNELKFTTIGYLNCRPEEALKELISNYYVKN